MSSASNAQEYEANARALIEGVQFAPGGDKQERLMAANALATLALLNEVRAIRRNLP